MQTELRKISATDTLWICILQHVEKKEKEDEMAGVTVESKSQKGRAQKMKKHLALETKPSPVGRRVEPRIDPSIRAKSEAAAARKKKAQAGNSLHLTLSMLMPFWQWMPLTSPPPLLSVSQAASPVLGKCDSWLEWDSDTTCWG